jgi:hypothetical protein
VTIQELGSLGEFVAAIATIATLVYLAVQIRQNTAATRAASHHEITDSFNVINVALGSDPILAALFRRGGEDRAALREDERSQYDWLCIAYFRVFETLFYQSRVGTGERELFQSEERSLRAALSRPGTRVSCAGTVWTVQAFASWAPQTI